MNTGDFNPRHSARINRKPANGKPSGEQLCYDPVHKFVLSGTERRGALLFVMTLIMTLLFLADASVAKAEPSQQVCFNKAGTYGGLTVTTVGKCQQTPWTTGGAGLYLSQDNRSETCTFNFSNGFLVGPTMTVKFVNHSCNRGNCEKVAFQLNGTNYSVRSADYVDTSAGGGAHGTNTLLPSGEIQGADGWGNGGGTVTFNSGPAKVSSLAIVHTIISGSPAGSVYTEVCGQVVPPSNRLTVSKAGTGSGTVTSGNIINCGTDCTEDLDPNQTVTLAATPDIYSVFTGWSGDCTGTGACTVAMSTSRNVTANFQAKPKDFGDAPFGTTLAQNGAYHALETALRLGANTDGESDGRPGADANGDDIDQSPDDEDAVSSFPLLTNISTNYTVSNIAVTNNTGAAATLYGWIDFNGNRSFEPGERATVSVPNGATTASLTWSNLSGVRAGRSYLRLRLSDQSGLAALGAGGRGEVEDHAIDVIATGTIVVRKELAGTAVGSRFAFTDTIIAPNSFTLGGGESKTYRGVLPGVYTVREDNPRLVQPGFILTTLRCDDQRSTSASTADLAARTATIRVDPGETVTCTFTNGQYDHIVVEKVTVPPGGAGFGFVFTDTNSLPTQFSLNHGQLLTRTIDTTGIYGIAEESIPSGWDLVDVSCTGANATVNGAAVSVNLPTLNDTAAHCTFTNHKRGKIVLRKETLPDGDPQSFTFGATGPAGPVTVDPLQDGGVFTLDNLKAGAWTIAETVPSGWDVTDLTCRSLLNTSAFTPTLSGGKLTGGLTLDLAPGDTADCTFTNAKHETFTVKKVLVPPPAPNQGPVFEFDKPAERLGNGQSFTRDVPPGVDFVVVERNPEAQGYTLTDISCSDNQGNNSYSIFLAKREVVFTGAPGLVAGCTFTNTLMGSIVISKTTQPDLTQSFSFTTTIPVPGGPDLSFDLRNGEAIRIDSLVPGTYQVAEQGLSSDVLLSNITCDDDASALPSVGIPSQGGATVNVEPGETVTCVFNNVQKDTVIVRKVVQPKSQGQFFNFTSTLPGANAFALQSGQLISVTGVIPNQAYTVAEADPTPGYDLVDVSCFDTASGQLIQGDLANRSVSFTPIPGHVVDCTFTNVKRGTVVIQKSVQPGSSVVPFDFSTDVGSPATFALSSGQNQMFTNVKPGTYSVTQLTDYPDLPLASVTCSDSDKKGLSSGGNPATGHATISLEPGETVVCDFLSIETDLVWIQKFTNPLGDTATDFSFATNLPGGNFTLKDQEGRAVLEVQPGQTYTIAETNVPSGYDLTGLACFDTFSNLVLQGDPATGSVSFTPEPGHLIYCAFENTKRGRLAIAKITKPATSDGFNFTLNGAGGPYTPTVVAGTVTAFDNLQPGTYTLVESDPTSSGYDFRGYECAGGLRGVVAGTTLTSTLAIGPGETITCTYTNAQRGVVRIRQQVDSGPTGPYSFVLSGASISQTIAFSLDAGGEYVATGLVAGQTYSILRDDLPGSETVSVTCTDSVANGGVSTASASAPVNAIANLDPAETVTCTFTNRQEAAPTALVPIEEPALAPERIYLPLVNR